jgi:hypothetical protein
LRGRGVVFLDGDVLAPGDGVALIVEFLQGEVGHEVVGAAPCQWSSPGSKQTRSPRADDLDRRAAALAATDAFGT